MFGVALYVSAHMRIQWRGVSFVELSNLQDHKRKKKQMIISAAVKALVNGEEHIFPVHRHGDFYLWMKYLHCDYDKSKVEQGFLDWNQLERKTEFVSRVEAFKRAQTANQIPRWKEPTELFSEDIW